MQGCVMKIMKKKQKNEQRPVLFCTQKCKIDRGFQKLIGTDHDQTSSIKASYNKGMYSNNLFKF